MRCSSCQALVTPMDRFCALCGAGLHRLSFEAQGVTTESSGGDVFFPINQNMTGIEITVHNKSPVPVALFYDPTVPVNQLPDWIKKHSVDSFSQQLLVIPSQSKQKLPIEFYNDLLRHSIEKLQQHTSSQALHKGVMPFYFSANVLGSSGYKPAIITLHLRPSCEPYVTPEGCIYRFIPWSELQKPQPYIHDLTIHNQTEHAIELQKITITPYASDKPISVLFDIPKEKRSQLKRFPENSVIFMPDTQRETIPANSQRKYDFLIRPVIEELHKDSSPLPLGWFAAEVSFTIEDENRQKSQLTTLIGGVIGLAPRLEVSYEGGDNQVFKNINFGGRITLKNPGHLPISISNYSIYRSFIGSDEQIPLQADVDDWLEVNDFERKDLVPLQKDITIAPNSTWSFDIQFKPMNRFDEAEIAATYCKRIISLQHNGFGKKNILIPIEAYLGSIEERPDLYLSIDFGTSNSVVQAVDLGVQAPRVLPLEQKKGDMLSSGPSKRQNELRSFIFFVPKNTKRNDLYWIGDKALKGRGLESTNLVRSMKSVVNDDASATYNFLKKGHTTQIVRTTVQKLLNAFILQLKFKADDATRFLDEDSLVELNLNQQSRVRFRKAVFTHPVEITDAGIQSLMEASHAAGLNRDCTDLEEFKSSYCIDESSAVVISYTYWLQQHYEDEITDKERVICFDIGGGTTDVTVAEIHINWEAEQPYKVYLLGAYGNSRFGGDNIDKLVATHLLSQLNLENRTLASEIRTALKYNSYSGYEHNFINRLGSQSVSSQRKYKQESRDNYRAAEDLLLVAEQAKINLSSQNKEEIILPESLQCKRNKYTLSRNDFESIIAQELSKQCKLLDDALALTDWQPSTPPTLLFSGKTSQIPAIQDTVITHMQSKYPNTQLRIVTPDKFDPKLCVSQGAAYWKGGYIKVVPPGSSALPWDLTVKMGPMYRKFLQKDMKFPIQKDYTLPVPKKVFYLYKGRGRFPYYSFTFNKPEKKLTIVLKSLNEIEIHTPGKVVYKGQVTKGDG